MRILLAALTAHKGDLAGNLASHQATLEEAWAQGCQLAVFPEFSLTGSVDPRRHPERALGLRANESGRKPLCLEMPATDSNGRHGRARRPDFLH